MMAGAFAKHLTRRANHRHDGIIGAGKSGDQSRMVWQEPHSSA
jgi:hypothetical protein